MAENKKAISKFAKGAYIMASLSKKPGSQPFNPNLWHLQLNIATENIITCSVWGASGSGTKSGETFIGMIASDHGVPGEETHQKSMCQHSKGFRYNFKTLVSFIAQPQEKRFWIFEGNPCENKVKSYEFN